ncbi:MAG TPA: hypothetical protein VJ020_08575 [Anaerolineales bacterium]|nr:hypothetical protein [Anaerolineales bacterium]
MPKAQPMHAFFVSIVTNEALENAVERARAAFARRNPGLTPTTVFVRPGVTTLKEIKGLAVIEDKTAASLGVGVGVEQ